jgi:Tol biopolymer transport system component
MALQAGDRLGPYRIVAPLGAGGMGEVYRAADSRLDREVAIKVVGTGRAADSDFRDRLQREARAISALNHPHVCTLHDVGHHDGVDYLVMELLEGESLAERLERGALPLADVLRYGIEIAEALDQAHRLGIVHRDLKPGNVMLTRSGSKLLDFGLARSQRSAEPAAAGLAAMPTVDRPLTAEGTLVGTFQYMAPEQLEGLAADARTDIFALGATLYEMATGRRAFEGSSRTSLIAAIVDRDPPPMSERQPATPPAFEHVVRVCLAKDPDRRWQSARDVATELRWISEAGSQAGIPAPLLARRRRREWLWRAAGALAVLGALVATGAWLRGRQRPVEPLRVSVVAPAGGRLLTTEHDAGALTLSPDGRYVTFAAEQGDYRGLWLRRLDEPEPRPIEGGRDGTYPFWAPDSRSLAFFQQGKLRRASVSGGPAVTIAAAPEARGGSWAPDGTILFESHWREPLSKVSAEGGPVTAATSLDPGRSETTHRWPWFLPDGRHFLYLAGSHTVDVGSELNAVYLASLDSPDRRLLLHTRSNVQYAHGHLLHVREGKLLAQPFDVEERRLSGDPVVLAQPVGYSTGFFSGLFATSGTGRVAWIDAPGDAASILEIRAISGGALLPSTTTPPEPALHRAIRYSPDGSRLALAIGDPADLWILDLERGTRTRLTSHPMDDDFPVWSPDGTRVAFTSDRDGKTKIFVKDLGRLEPELELLRDDRATLQVADWSRDGRLLVYERDEEGKSSDVYVMSLGQESKPVAVAATDADEWGGALSPDGKWIAYCSDETGRPEAYVAPFPGPGPKRLVSRLGGARVGWSADGRSLYVRTDPRRLWAIAMDAGGFGEPRLLLELPTGAVSGDLHPRGDEAALAFEVPPRPGLAISLLTDWPATLAPR